MPGSYLRFEAPGASLRQNSVFSLHPIALPVFLLFLLLILLLFLRRLLSNSLIQLLAVVTLVVQPLDALKGVQWLQSENS